MEKDRIEKHEDEIEVPETSRREFMSKLVTAAGAVAVAGIVGATGASAEEIKLDHPTLKFGKLRNGFRLTMTGGQVGDVLKQMGAATEDANLSNAKITIEFSA